MAARAVHHPLISKEKPEDPDLKEAALVAHLHPLVQEHPAVAVLVNEQVPQLGPGQHQHGKVAPL